MDEDIHPLHTLISKVTLTTDDEQAIDNKLLNSIGTMTGESPAYFFYKATPNKRIIPAGRSFPVYFTMRALQIVCTSKKKFYTYIGLLFIY